MHSYDIDIKMRTDDITVYRTSIIICILERGVYHDNHQLK